MLQVVENYRISVCINKDKLYVHIIWLVCYRQIIKCGQIMT
jgi:hypothetical protein